jgi:hypothetical protein
MAHHSSRCVLAVLLLAAADARAEDAAGAQPPAPPAPQAGANDVVEYDPEAPTSDDRLRAATSAGVIAFVGLTIGAVGIPGALGIVASAVGGILPEQALYIAAVVGGATGAAAGGIIGGVPLVKWWGLPLVGAAAAVGACVGLVPTALLSYAAAVDPPAAFDSTNPVIIGQSASLVLAMVGAAGGAALAGAWSAEKREIEAQ